MAPARADLKPAEMKGVGRRGGGGDGRDHMEGRLAALVGCRLGSPRPTVQRQLSARGPYTSSPTCAERERAAR